MVVKTKKVAVKKVKVKKCQRCNLKFPENILIPMKSILPTSSKNKMMCGICALESINQILGTRKKALSNAQAEEKRLEAIKHLTQKNEKK